MAQFLVRHWLGSYCSGQLVARRRPVALKNKEPRKIDLESAYSSRSVVNVFIH